MTRGQYLILCAMGNRGLPNTAYTTMHILTDEFVEPPMNHALIVNLLASLFSIAQTGGSVE